MCDSVVEKSDGKGGGREEQEQGDQGRVGTWEERTGAGLAGLAEKKEAISERPRLSIGQVPRLPFFEAFPTWAKRVSSFFPQLLACTEYGVAVLRAGPSHNRSPAANLVRARLADRA